MRPKTYNISSIVVRITWHTAREKFHSRENSVYIELVLTLVTATFHRKLNFGRTCRARMKGRAEGEQTGSKYTRGSRIEQGSSANIVAKKRDPFTNHSQRKSIKETRTVAIQTMAGRDITVIVRMHRQCRLERTDFSGAKGIISCF